MVNCSTRRAELAGLLFRVAAVIELRRQVPSALATNVVFVVLYVPLPLTLTVCVKAGVLSVLTDDLHRHVARASVQTK
jgi:hypothetical protein